MKNNRGFTLFELLVSISIIGILTALASVAYSGAQKKARDARRVQDLKLVQTAAEQYYSQNNFVYPTSDSGPWVSGTGDTILSITPSDPKPSNTQYKYSFPSPSNGTYCACAKMENISNGNSTKNDCTFATSSVGGTGPFFCVKNQQ